MKFEHPRMTLIEYSTDDLAGQPIGYWSGAAHRIITTAIRASLARQELTQPHWWVLNQVRSGLRERTAVVGRLAPFVDPGVELPAVIDDLTARGWLTGDDTLTLTADGAAGRDRAADDIHALHVTIHDGVSTQEYVAALDVLRRMIDNLGGDGNIP